MTCLITQITLFQFLETLQFFQFTASFYMTDLVAWWIAHVSLSRASKIVSLLGLVSNLVPSSSFCYKLFLCVFFNCSGDKVGLVSLSWCPTALKLGPATSFCLLHTHLFLSFSRLVCSYFVHCITHLAIYKILYQLFGDYCIFPVHSQFINKLVSSWSMFQSPTSVWFVSNNPSLTFAYQNTFIFVSLFPFPPH